MHKGSMRFRSDRSPGRADCLRSPVVKTHLMAAAAAALLLCSCGGQASPHRARPTHSVSTHRRRAAAPVSHPPIPAQLEYRHLYTLSAPLRDPASASLGGGRYELLGGLNDADVSVAGIESGDLHGVTTAAATMPEAQHDAQAATLAGAVYVFGGGSASELDHIVRFDPASGAVTTVGSLPAAQSDVAVTAVGGTAYVFGGYDGTSWLNTILAYRPGAPVRVAGHLPVGLRYAATAAVGGTILVIGGSTPTAASNVIYAFSTATGRVRVLGHLAAPITHASAAALGGYVYLIGGRGDALDSQTSAIWSIDPPSGRIRRAGHLPAPASDTGVVAVAGAVVVAGGLTPSGATLDTVGALVPRR